MITAKPHLVKGRRVCDLGAGLGIAGIAAALAGVRPHPGFPRADPSQCICRVCDIMQFACCISYMCMVDVYCIRICVLCCIEIHGKGCACPDLHWMSGPSYCTTVRTCPSRRICRRHEVLPDPVCRCLPPFCKFCSWGMSELFCNGTFVSRLVCCKLRHVRGVLECYTKFLFLRFCSIDAVIGVSFAADLGQTLLGGAALIHDNQSMEVPLHVSEITLH